MDKSVRDEVLIREKHSTFSLIQKINKEIQQNHSDESPMTSAMTRRAAAIG